MSILSDDSPVVQIPLSKGYTTTIDECDSDLSAINWAVRICRSGLKHAFRHRRQQGKRLTVYLHRVIMGRVLGRDLDSSEIVDHVDGNGLNNTRANLRLASHSQNLFNRGKASSNTSGYKGVYWCKSTQRWSASISVDNKYIWLGRFDSKHEAARAFNRAALEYHGDFARLNIIEESEE
jgi:hypothetical protein